MSWLCLKFSVLIDLGDHCCQHSPMALCGLNPDLSILDDCLVPYLIEQMLVDHSPNQSQGLSCNRNKTFFTDVTKKITFPEQRKYILASQPVNKYRHGEVVLHLELLFVIPYWLYIACKNGLFQSFVLCSLYHFFSICVLLSIQKIP